MNIERVKYEKFIYCQQNLKPTQFEIYSKTVCVCVFFLLCSDFSLCEKYQFSFDWKSSSFLMQTPNAKTCIMRRRLRNNCIYMYSNYIH